MATTHTVIAFSLQTGHGRCLHTEAINLKRIGHVTHERASEVEYNNDRGEWEVRINGSVHFSDESRQVCLDWEREHFNAEILAHGN